MAIRAQSFEISDSPRSQIASFPPHSSAITLIDSRTASDNDFSSKISEADPSVPLVAPSVEATAEVANLVPRSPEEEQAADAERRNAALLEMLAHEPPHIGGRQFHRRQRRSVDGGIRMNGTGPRHGAPSPAPTTTTFATDVVTESLSTLPPRYAEYERRSERVSRGTGSWSMGEEQPPAY